VRRRTREASEKLRQAKEKVTDAYDRTADRAARAYREARGYAQEHPDVAAAVSFAAGMGVGVMIAGRNGRSYRRGLVPVFAIALAQAVLDVFDGQR
jgi:ABC-type sugar transport system substrate-binding protein